MEAPLCFGLASTRRGVTDTTDFRFQPLSRKLEVPASLAHPSWAQPGLAPASSELGESDVLPQSHSQTLGCGEPLPGSMAGSSSRDSPQGRGVGR